MRLFHCRSPCQTSPLSFQPPKSTKCHVSPNLTAQIADSQILDSLSVAAGGLAATSLGWATLKLAVKEENNEGIKGDLSLADEDDDAIKWTLAGLVSCFPYLNWVAWIFLALDTDESFAYYLLAGLYSSPFLLSGLNFTAFSMFMVVNGILHIQVERIAETEPYLFQELLEGKAGLINGLRTIVSAFGTSSTKVISDMGSNVQKISSKAAASKLSDESTVLDIVEAKLSDEDNSLRNSKELSELEKKLWDQTLKDREENQQQE